MFTFPLLQRRGAGSCERIQFSLPSLVRRGCQGVVVSPATRTPGVPLNQGGHSLSDTETNFFTSSGARGEGAQASRCPAAGRRQENPCPQK
jgi:hypothetical protein